MLGQPLSQLAKPMSSTSYMICHRLASDGGHIELRDCTNLLLAHTGRLCNPSRSSLGSDTLSSSLGLGLGRGSRLHDCKLARAGVSYIEISAELEQERVPTAGRNAIAGSQMHEPVADLVPSLTIVIVWRKVNNWTCRGV
jgi:hypothetical protein